MKNNWVIGVVGSVFGFLVSQFIVFYTFTANLETTKKIEMINLGRELVQDFYGKDNVLFKDIRTSIESCDKLYKGFNKSGKFDHDEINKYLGFFDALGFYYGEGVLNIKVINQFFGAYIIEAYEYDELRKYTETVQNNAKQKFAFAEFQALSLALEKIPERLELTELARRRCSTQ